MATRIEDSTGKFIEATEDATEAMKALVDSLKGATRKSTSFGGNSLADAIKKLPEEFVKRFSKELKDFKKTVEDIRDFVEKVDKKRSRGMGGAGRGGGMSGAGRGGMPGASSSDFRQEKKNMSFVENITKELLRYMNRIRRSSKAWGHDMSAIANYGSEIKSEMKRVNEGIDSASKEFDKILKKNEKEAKYLEEISAMWEQLSSGERARLKLLMRELAELKKQGAGAEEVVAKYNQIVKASKEIHDKHHLIWGTLKKAASEAGKLAGHLGGVFSGIMGSRFIGSFFDNLNESLNQLQRETSTMRALFSGKSFAGFGNYFDDLVDKNGEFMESVGQLPTVVRGQWLKAFKKGTKSLEDMQDTITSSLRLATQIGSSAEGTADEFQKWNMHLGLGSKQTTALARNIRQASSDIGVFGDEMLKAAASAREIAHEIRKAGFDAENVADQVIRMQTAGEKFGVGKELGDIQRILGGGLSGFKDASSTMKNLMAQSGNIPGIISGQTASGAGMKDATNRIAQMLKKEIAAAGGVGPDGAIDLSKIPDEMKSKLDFIFKQRFGKDFGLGNAKIIVDAIEDANTTNEDKLAKLEKELKTNNSLTDKERAALEKNIALQRGKIGQANTTKALNELKESIKGVGDFARFGGNLQKSIDGVNEKLKEAGKEQLDGNNLMRQFQDAQVKGDRKGMAEIYEKLSEMDEVANTALKMQGSTMDKAESERIKRQTQIQQLVNGGVKALGFLPGIALTLIGIASSLVGLLQLRALVGVARKHLGIDEKFVGKALRPGSIYTHDTHSERYLRAIARKQGANVVGGGKGGVKGGKGGGGMMGMMGGMGMMKFLGPIGIIIGIFTLLASSSEKLQQSIGKVLEKFMPLLVMAGDFVAEIIEMLMPVFEEMVPVFVEIFEAIKPVIKELITALIPVFKALVQLWKAIVVPQIKVLVWIFKEIFVPVLRVVFTIVEKVAKFLESVFIPIWNALKSVWEALSNFWTNTLKPVWDAIYGAFETFKNAFKDAVDWVLRQANRVNPLTDAGDVDAQGKPVERNWIERRGRNLNPFTGGGIFSGLNPFDSGPGTFEKNKMGTWSNLKEGNVWGSIKSIFADGGIVGSSKDGEAIPVIAHANEWILNGEQQGRLLEGVNAMADFKQALIRSSMSGLDDRVQREVQGSRPSASMTATNEELAKIAINTEMMVQVGVEQVKLMNELVDTLSTDNDGKTKKSRPRMIPNYYTWKAGRYGDTAVKQFVNPG